MRQFRSFLLIIIVAGCGPTGGKIVSSPAPTTDAKTDGTVIVLTTSTSDPTGPGGIFVIESYGVPYDSGVMKPLDSGSTTPPTTSCTPGSVYLCDPLCANGKHSQTQCNATGDGFVQKPNAVAYGICFCPEETIYPDAGLPATPPPASDAATIQPPTVRDAGVPDAIVTVKEDTARPDLAPDSATKTDVYVPDVYIPVSLPPSPDVQPAPDLRTPDVYVPDVYVPDTYIADTYMAPDTMPDTITQPDVWTQTDTYIPPPVTVCDSSSESIVSAIALTKVCQPNQLIFNWTTGGCSSHGYKFIWSTNPGPTYPARPGKNDHPTYLSDPHATTITLTGTPTSGTIYAVVCQYINGACGTKSNELEIDLGTVFTSP